MRARSRLNQRLLRLSAMLLGTSLFLNSCDPTLQNTVENGIINASTSLLGAFLQALTQVASQQGM